MFQKIIKHPRFWRSVVLLGFSFVFLFLIVKWILEGFSFSFITQERPVKFLLVTLLAGFAYGFFVTYGKFWRQFKEKNK